MTNLLQVLDTTIRYLQVMQVFFVSQTSLYKNQHICLLITHISIGNKTKIKLGKRTTVTLADFSPTFYHSSTSYTKATASFLRRRSVHINVFTNTQILLRSFSTCLFLLQSVSWYFLKIISCFCSLLKRIVKLSSDFQRHVDQCGVLPILRPRARRSSRKVNTIYVMAQKFLHTVH